MKEWIDKPPTDKWLELLKKNYGEVFYIEKNNVDIPESISIEADEYQIAYIQATLPKTIEDAELRAFALTHDCNETIKQFEGICNDLNKMEYLKKLNVFYKCSNCNRTVRGDFFNFEKTLCNLCFEDKQEMQKAIQLSQAYY